MYVLFVDTILAGTVCLISYSNCFTENVEVRIKHTLKNISAVSVADIEKIVTAKHICWCGNPLEIAFEVSKKVSK